MASSPSSLPPIDEFPLSPASLQPRYLQLRVASLERSVRFFHEVLGFKVVRHIESDTAGLRSSLTDVAASDRGFAFRLEYVYGASAFPLINHCEFSLRAVEIHVPGALSKAKVLGYKTSTLEDESPLVIGPDELPIALSEIVQAESASGGNESASGSDAVSCVTLWVNDLDDSIAFYESLFTMSLVSGAERSSEGRKPLECVQLAFHGTQYPRLKLVQRAPQTATPSSATRSIDVDSSRSAVTLGIIAADSTTLRAVAHRARMDTSSIGAVMKVQDLEGNEIDIFESAAFDSPNTSHTQSIDWAWRASHGSGESEQPAKDNTSRKREGLTEDWVNDADIEEGGDNVEDERARKRSK